MRSRYRVELAPYPEVDVGPFLAGAVGSPKDATDHCDRAADDARILRLRAFAALLKRQRN